MPNAMVAKPLTDLPTGAPDISEARAAVKVVLQTMISRDSGITSAIKRKKLVYARSKDI
jgi:hypothetical protein